MKLLVIDDDRMFGELIRRGLKEEGYTVDVCRSVSEGRMAALVHEYDGIVLDVMLPDGNGMQLAQELRNAGRRTPILMLTSNDSTDDIVRGLDNGADDYLTKPVEIRELKARVRALVRRGGAQRTETLAFGGVAIDRLAHRATLHGRALDLTPKEFSLLEHLLLQPGKVVTRTELLEKVWDLQFDPGSNVVDVHVARLRSKLRRMDGPELRTVRGVGFTLAAPAVAAG